MNRRLAPGPRHWPLSLPVRPLLLLALLVSGCGGPRAPDWAYQAHDALDRSVQANLAGRQAVAEAELAMARKAITAPGRPELAARLELHACAANVASLTFGPCTGFEALRADADAPALAYADHLSGVLAPSRRALLPPAQQALASRPDGSAADVQRLQAQSDPLSRLVGAALWQRQGLASDAVVAEAVATASDQGWRRPLVAWLQVQRDRAQRRGDLPGADRIARRIALVLGGHPTR